MCPQDTVSKSDPCVRNRIRKDKTPRGAKITQESAEKAGLVRDDWGPPSEVRLKSMNWVLELKLYWNPETFGRVLNETGDLPIVEISGKDSYWGCRDEGDGRLVGENYLGRLLMRVRNHAAEVTEGKFTSPKGFLLS